MKFSDRFSEMIDQYLAGKLNTDELAAFNKLLAEHPELEDEIRVHRQLRNAVKAYDEIELRRKLRIIHKNYMAQQKPVLTRLLVRWSKVAAVVVLIIASAIVFYAKLINHSYTNNELFAMYYKPYEIQVFRSATTEENKLFNEAVEKYYNRDFEQAIILFEKVIDTDQERMDANLMSGISKIEIKRYSEANRNFQKIINHRDNLYLEHAEWYLGLCYLMTNDNEKAKEQFMKIVKREGYYSKDARKILKKM
jgi:tetratricopeptide (TPR) repeat protein